MGSYLKRHLGFIIFWHLPGEKDRGFHHSFDTKTCGKCYWVENKDFVSTYTELRVWIMYKVKF